MNERNDGQPVTIEYRFIAYLETICLQTINHRTLKVPCVLFGIDHVLCTIAGPALF